jgi:hypothetical protein
MMECTITLTCGEGELMATEMMHDEMHSIALTRGEGGHARA